MSTLASSLSNLIAPLRQATNESTVSIRVPVNALTGSLDTGLRKRNGFARLLPVVRHTRVAVEAAEAATSDSVFFVPEAPNADQSQQRVTPTQFIKVCPEHHDDMVRVDDDYEVSFVGMSVTPHDMFGDNDLLLCSFAREDRIGVQMMSKKMGELPPTELIESLSRPSSATGSESEQLHGLPTADMKPILDAAQVPAPLRMHPNDIPFIHYDPIVDGHDVGNKPNTFVPIPGSKRVYKQRRARETTEDALGALFVRFTVMEIDKLSDDQLAAIKSLETISNSISNASATIPYLKFVSWILKFGNRFGQSALKKVSAPDHVMSQDMCFKIARNDRGDETRRKHDQYGDYLRYGSYYFLSQKVDAKLYVQTGSSSQTAPLLLKRSGYKAHSALMNEKEYFLLTGVSYVAMKVSRGCSPMLGDRRETVFVHRERLNKLFAKYMG